ncbi:hypothetical protein HDU76_011722 [Blyttiomyces sp. JEL0837]|nr:hypothetical protein HDU76_011722 [Blyttiomyces sp. JEL0837]
MSPQSSQDVRAAWGKFFDDPMLSMDRIRDIGLRGGFGDGHHCRSLYWKIYLEYLPSLETEAWPLVLQKERNGYDDLKKRFIFDPNREAQKMGDMSLNNPLSLAEESPWTQYFKDTELQKLIRQDVERTMPDQQFFRGAEIQDLMTNILFVWCKLNPDVSYRQGMHEILAPILYVVDTDKVDATQSSGLTELQLTVFDARFVEHDTSVLFYRIMRSAKIWYETGESAGVNSPKGRPQRPVAYTDRSQREKTLPIVAQSKRIQNELLRAVDPELHQHLDDLKLEPQLYALRWLRLIFGREFAFEDLMILWDGIFAEDPNLGLVEWICISLLVFLRKDLLEADYSMALYRLMKFPTKEELQTEISEFIASAKGLRERFAQRAVIASTPASARASNLPSSPPPPAPKSSTASTKRNTVPWATLNSSTSRPRQADSDEAAPPVAAVEEPTAAEKSKITLLESRVASLWRETQKLKDKNSKLAAKVERCVDILATVLEVGPNGTMMGPERAGEVEGVADELRVVISELRGEELPDTPKVIKKREGPTVSIATEETVVQDPLDWSKPSAMVTDRKPVQIASSRYHTSEARTAVTVLGTTPDSANDSATSQDVWAASLSAAAQVDATMKTAAGSVRKAFSDLFDDKGLFGNAAWRGAKSVEGEQQDSSAGRTRPVETVNDPLRSEIEEGYKSAALPAGGRRTFPPTQPSTGSVSKSMTSPVTPTPGGPIKSIKPTFDPLAGVPVSQEKSPLTRIPAARPQEARDDPLS